MLTELQQTIRYMSLRDGVSYITEYKKRNISPGEMDQTLSTFPELLTISRQNTIRYVTELKTIWSDF